MFAIITPALITGAFAERKKFATFLVFTLLWATLVYNPLAENRSVIGLAISSDGKSWKHVTDLESTQEPGKADLAHNPGELSYPAVVQARDGKVHITYTWKREKIRHVIVDPARIGN